jgi:iron complex outermembrane receptor protein
VFTVVSASSAALTPQKDEVVVTATRIGQPPYKLAANVTVISREQIEASAAQTIPDILKEALGVHVYDNGTLKSASVDIRGFGDTATRNVLIMIDGRRVNSVDISGPDLVQVPLQAVERIEIIRGSGSVLYGDNAVGGVVNIITKKGEGEAHGRIGGTYGSYDAQGTDLEISGEHKKLSYFLYSKYLDHRGYRDNSDLLAHDLNGRFGYEVSEKLNVDLNVGWHEDDQELPGGLTDSQLVTYGRRGTATDLDITNTTDRYVKVGFDFEPWPEDVHFGNFIVDLHYRNRDVYDSFNSFGAFNTKRSIDTTGVTGKYVFDREIMEHEVNFVTGVDYSDIKNDILGSGTNVDDITITKVELGLFGFLETELFDQFFLNGGTRYHRADYTFNQRNAVVFQKQSPDEWVSMGGAKYEYAPGSNLHLNVQQTFRFLATDEWYSTANFPAFGLTPGLNLNLDQQTGIQYEAGVKHNFNDQVVLSLTPYWINLKNEIFFDPVTFANSNYDKTRRAGIEFGARFDLLKWLDAEFLSRLEFFSNYTYEDPRFVNGASDDKFIPMVPQHLANSGINASVWDHYDVSLIGHYVGSRFPVNDTLNTTSRVEPHYVLDGKVAYRQDEFEVFAAINNITDEIYETFVSKSTFSSTKSHFPAPERNFLFGMNVKF